MTFRGARRRIYTVTYWTGVTVNGVHSPYAIPFPLLSRLTIGTPTELTFNGRTLTVTRVR